ncbi:MAG: YqgE/AlgH family protein [Bacteroidales bacterium]|jgi:putative transcriptional regulator
MDLNFDFFHVEPKDHKVAKGRVLISEPFLSDQYFKRSIVFLVEHNEEGSVGFILNKPVHIALSELLKNFPDVEASVSLGGPVGTNTVHYIHTLGERIPNSMRVFHDIYWGGDFDIVKELMIGGVMKPGQIRFFVGYSGWMPSQLENEIHENSWLVTRVDPATIMSCSDREEWRAVLRKMKDKKYRLWADFPENPTNN